jgi:branched-chain amino acid transport system substrate-binding protein
MDRRQVPSIGLVKDLFKVRPARDLSDSTSRQFPGLRILAGAIDQAKSAAGPEIAAALTAIYLPGDAKFVTVSPSAFAAAPAQWPMNA